MYNKQLAAVNKVFGNKSIYSPIRKDGNRTIVCYEYEDVKDGENATWYEVVFYNFKNPHLSLQTIKEAIIKDINSQTDEKILNGYQWKILRGRHVGETVNVWLSEENQNNFKAFHDAVKNYPELDAFPATYKLAEDENGDPIYETFESISELSQFYIGSVAYIQNTLSEGWGRKDSIDWSLYEEALKETEE